MKTTIHTLMLALLLVILLTASGCQTTPGNAASPENEPVTLNRNDPHILSKIMPNPLELFPDATFVITDPDDGLSYQFCLNNGNVEMFNEYVKAVRDAGFTARVSMISNQIYQAFTEDGLFKTIISYYENEDHSVTYVYAAVWIIEEDTDAES